MATSLMMDPTNGTPIPPITAPAKRPVGRPRKNPDPQPPLVDSSDENDIQIYFATSTDDEWAMRHVYMWRYQPHTKGSKPTSCGQFGSKFDFDDVLKTMGSGVYRFDVVQNPPGGIWPDGSTKGKRVRQGFATIINPEYPPNIPLGDWTEDARNADWMWAVPMLEAKFAQYEPDDDEDDDDEGPMHQTPDEMLATIKKGVDMFRPSDQGNNVLAAQIVDLVKDNQSQMRDLLNPAKQFETMQRLMTLVTPKPDTSANLIVEILRDQLNAARTEMIEMRKEIREAGQSKSLVEQLRDIIPAIQDLAPILGLGGRARAPEGTNWGEVALGVADKLSPVLTAIVEKQMQGPPPAPAPREFQPAAPRPTGPHGSTPEPSATPNPRAAAAPPPPAMSAEPLPPGVTQAQVDAEQQKLNAIVRKHGSLFATVASTMVDKYKHETGYDFRDWLVARKGQELWLTLKNDVEEPARLVALTQMSAMLRQQLTVEPKLFQFMKEFLTNVGEEDVEPEVADAA